MTMTQATAPAGLDAIWIQVTDPSGRVRLEQRWVVSLPVELATAALYAA